MENEFGRFLDNSMADYGKTCNPRTMAKRSQTSKRDMRRIQRSKSPFFYLTTNGRNSLILLDVSFETISKEEIKRKVKSEIDSCIRAIYFQGLGV